MERTILHLNIADFGVAVERLLDRSLAGRPLIIAQSSPRAVVYDMSDEAYGDGVRKGMLLGLARKRCRTARLLPPRPEQYHKALGRCLSHALHYTPLVERSSGNGHLYLDVTGTHRLFGPAPDIGWRLRNTLRRDLGLDPIWAVAPNKLVAKVASRLVKPRGEYIVAGGEEETFLAPLPLGLLPGILPADLLCLRAVNISRVHQLTPLSVRELTLLCDQRARFLYQTIRGIDPSPVLPERAAGEGGCLAHTFAPDSNREEVVRAALAALAARAGHGLRSRGLGCRRLAISLTYTDGIRVTRQAVAREVVADDPGLEHLARTALYRAWHRRVRLRRLELVCSSLAHPVRQLSLFAALDGRREKNLCLSQALDRIRSRCGSEAIARGSRQPLIAPAA